MRPVKAYLFDYDECGDILRDDYSHNDKKVKSIRSRFLQYLEPLTEGDSVEFLSISLRQDTTLDYSNARRNKNGTSFVEFPRLCCEQGWTFDEHLLPDDNFCGDGYTFQGDSNIQLFHSYERFLFYRKFSIINSQLEQVRKNHSGSPITVHVFDDRKDILDCLMADLNGESLQDYYSSWKKSPDQPDCCCFKRGFSKVERLQQERGGRLLQIPENVTLHIHRADWRKEYSNMVRKDRSEANDFVRELGVFTSNGPVVDRVVESKEDELLQGSVKLGCI